MGVVVFIGIVILIIYLVRRNNKKKDDKSKTPPAPPTTRLQPEYGAARTPVYTPPPQPQPQPVPPPKSTADERIKRAKKLLPKDDVEFKVEEGFSLKGKEFSLAGVFASSPNSWGPVIELFEDMGGHYVPNVHATCRVLIIGAEEQPGWEKGQYGPEIAKALERVNSDGWVNLRLIFEDALI